jgi:hypothetical protein
VSHLSAEQCCTEARLLYPLSYLILFVKGEIHQVGNIFQLQSHVSSPVCVKVRGEWELAKTCYQDSLSINPHHLASLQSLGLTHLQLGSPRFLFLDFNNK